MRKESLRLDRVGASLLLAHDFAVPLLKLMRHNQL
jgi:hypothetical protein